jgi:hypothetical protein
MNFATRRPVRRSTAVAGVERHDCLVDDFQRPVGLGPIRVPHRHIAFRPSSEVEPARRRKSEGKNADAVLPSP